MRRLCLLLATSVLVLPASAAAHGSGGEVAPAPVARAAAAPAVCPGDPITPTRVITGDFDAAQQGSYVMLPFDVPAGTTAVRVKYCHDQPETPTSAQLKHTLDLGIYEARDTPGELFDLEEFRGWGGSSHPDTTVSAEGFSSDEQYKSKPKGNVPGKTTRGFTPGPIKPGEWAVELGLAAIIGQSGGDLDGKVAYRVEIELSADRAFADEPYKPTPYQTAPARTGPGWYSGDLHVHAEHSALGDATMREVFDFAFKPAKDGGAGLDFLTLSDYVGGSQHDEIGRFQGGYPGKLVMRSAEIITYRGHTNNHASAAKTDYRTGPILERTPLGTFEVKRPARPPSEIFDAVHAGGGFTQINHPTIFPSEVPLFAALCRGCPWDYSDAETQWDKVDAYEVATGPPGNDGGSNPFTTTAVDEFDSQRRKGHDITAVAVSDSHNAGRTPGGVTQAPIGTGTTVVFADELSEKGVQRAVEKGHAFVKIFGSSGPDLRLDAKAPGGATAMMGDGLQEQRADFTARVIGGGPASNGGRPRQLLVMRDGSPVDTVPVTSDDFAHRFSASGRGDIRLQLMRQAAIEGLTNPITLGATASGGPPVSAAKPAPPGRARIRISVSPRRVRAGGRVRFSFRAFTTAGRKATPVSRATIRFAGRRLRTNVRGRAHVTMRVHKVGVRRVVATRRGLRAGHSSVRVTR